MPDLIDDANDKIEKEADKRIELIRQQAADIPKGHPGDCYQCGEPSPRIVRGRCAPCRDLHGE